MFWEDKELPWLWPNEQKGLLLLGLGGHSHFWLLSEWHAMLNGQLGNEQANLKSLLLWTRAFSVSMAPTAADRAAPCFPTTVGHTPWHCGQNKTTLPWAAFVISSLAATRKAVLRFDSLMWGHAVSETPLLCWETEEELELGWEKPYNISSFPGDSTASSEGGTPVLMWTVMPLIWRDGLLVRSMYCSEEAPGCSSPNLEVAL